jgi:hypothetical protein
MIFGAQLGDTFSTLRLEVDVVGADYRESVHPVGWRLSRAASRFGKRGPHQPAGCAAKAWATHKASNTFRTQVGIRGQLLRSPLSLSLADAGPAIAQSIHVQRVSRCSLWQAARASAARMRPQAFRVAASQRGKPSARGAFRQTSIVLQCSRCALKSLRLAGRARAARISGARAASVTSTLQGCAVALACRHAIALS